LAPVVISDYCSISISSYSRLAPPSTSSFTSLRSNDNGGLLDCLLLANKVLAFCNISTSLYSASSSYLLSTASPFVS